MRTMFAFLLVLTMVMAPAAAQSAPAAGAQTMNGSAGSGGSIDAHPSPAPAPCDKACQDAQAATANWLKIAGFASVIVATVAVLVFVRFTEVLRDGVPDSFAGAPLPSGAKPPFPVSTYRRCYSLAQTQMTWWFWVVFSSFLYLACANADPTGKLTQESLILIGIGAGTALGATIIEQTKKDKATAYNQFNQAYAQIVDPAGPGVPNPPFANPYAKLNEAAVQLKSDGFLRDVLSDNTGVSLHRFQSFAWTLVLGLVFLIHVYTHNEMPKLTTLELSLLGISAGTYLGFKIPE